MALSEANIGARRLRAAGRLSALEGGRPTWLVLPAVVVLLLVVVIVELLGAYIAFFSINLNNLSRWYQAPFAGLRNFVFALTDSSPAVTSALHALAVSLKFAFWSTIVATPIGIIAALATHHSFRGRALLRSWFLVPYVIPTVVVAMIGRMLFANGTGLVDLVKGAVGLGSTTYWLLGPNSFWAMLAVEIWTAWPFTYLMVLAALSAVPHELYESTELDGGGSWAKFRFVVFPHVRGVILMSIVLSAIARLGSFTLPYVMFNNPPPVEVSLLPINIYFRAFSTFQFGYAAATGLFMIAVVAIPAFIYIRATRLRTEAAGGEAS
jgi:multiple sugar transport system permease protein